MNPGRSNVTVSAHGRDTVHAEDCGEAPIIDVRTDWLNRDAFRSPEIAAVIAIFTASIAFAIAALN